MEALSAARKSPHPIPASAFAADLFVPIPVRSSRRGMKNSGSGFTHEFTFILLLALLTAIGSAAYGEAYETLFAADEGRFPRGNLVQGSDGNLYGTTSAGGARNEGSVFKVTLSGELTTLVSFNSSNGRYPNAGLVEGSDGNFYGTTSSGGASKSGTVFKMTPSGELTTLVSFNFTNGSSPQAGLIEGSDGNFYGTTLSGGVSNFGTIFKITPSGELTTLVSFNSTNGSAPLACLVEGSDGNFYGTTLSGGASKSGTVFKMTPSGELTTLVSFNFTNGSSPHAGLIEGSDGNFYGTTGSGGTRPSGGGSKEGTVFKITQSGELTTLVSFSSTTGSSPRAGLVVGSDGNFYGTTSSGGASIYGTVFKMTPSGELTTLVSFNSTNGSSPQAGLIAGSDGNFYGTTSSGGASRSGTVFKVTPSGKLTTLASFGSTNGSSPQAGLLEGSDGNFYGTTSSGGVSNFGTVFKVTPSGEFTTLVSFNATNGRDPYAGLVEGSDGSFYGTTQFGGASNHGTVFKVTSPGELTTLVSFNSTNGSFPRAGLVEGRDGNFYGTTSSGGASRYGTVFKMTPSGELTTLVSFNSTNGSSPYGGLVEGSDGNFYGTTFYGGASDGGTVFKVTAAGELTTLVSFDSSIGRFPHGELVEGRDGNFYGTTAGGEESGERVTVFKMTRSGELTTLVSFKSTNGSSFHARLVEGSDGNFYGTASLNTTNASGSVFRVTPSGEFTIFNGSVPAGRGGTPIFGSDGKLYGTAEQMVIWRLSVPTAPRVTTTPPKTPATTGVDLSGIVTANGSETTVTFDYGLTPEYGSSIAATPGIVTGAKGTFVGAKLSGLLPHTTYLYRITATSSGGTTSTARVSFTTANSLPVATNDTFIPAVNPFGEMTLDVLQNDRDADGDPLTITSVTQGAFGTVTIIAGNLTYTPTRGFVGRDTFSYTVSDGFAKATAQVELRPIEVVSRVLFSEGSEVPGAGIGRSELVDGTLFKRFGVPAINSSGGMALTASYRTRSGASEQSILVLDPRTSISKLAARRGQIVPRTGGALFSAFEDPLLNESGDVAFLATLSGGDATMQNRKGIWINPSSATGSSGVRLVAQTGAQPPGTPEGARWRKFTSVALSSSSYSDDANVENGWLLAFTAWMTPGAGGVDRTNDKGLWIATPGNTVLALREEQTLQLGETQKRISSLTALKALPNAQGQGRGVTSQGAVAVHAIFTDGSQALLQVSREGPSSDNILIEELARSGDPAKSTNKTVGRFGLATQSGSGEAIAWVGTLGGKGNPAALFHRKLSDIGFSKVMIRQGDAAAGIEGAAFSAFKSVAVNDLADTLFVGKVAGRGISKAGNEGLWWKSGSVENSSFHLLAREGAQPPGVPEGTKWSTFTSVALPEEPYGPLFTARLAVGQHGKAGPGGTTEATDEGLWAADSSGQLRLVVREGQEVMVEGSRRPKILGSFTVLSAVPGSPAQRRSFAGDGQIVYRALFTDGSQAVVKVQLP